MSGADQIEEGIARAHRRAVARILDAKEEIADPHLPEAARAELRKVVMDSLRDFKDAALLHGRDGITMDGYAITLLEQIHAALVPAPELDDEGG